MTRGPGGRMCGQDAGVERGQGLRAWGSKRKKLIWGNKASAAVCRRLLSDYGHTTVTLSAANTHSYEKREVTFSEYCHK